MNQTAESSQITTNNLLLNSYSAVYLHGIVFPSGRISRPTLDPLRDLRDGTFLKGLGRAVFSLRLAPAHLCKVSKPLSLPG